MTVKGLSEFLKKKDVPFTGRHKDEQGDPLFLNQLKGQYVAIEVAGMIYKVNWAAASRVVEQHDYIQIDGARWSRPATEEVLSMFKVFFKRHVQKLLEAGIKPVFIIEGKSPDMKQGTVQKRVEARSSNEDKTTSVAYGMDQIGLNAYKKKLVYSYMPNQEHTHAVIEVLTEMDLPVLRAKHEAEGVCAFLVNTPLNHQFHCACALTDDHDIFMYGCKAVIRDLRAADAKFGNFECVGYSYVDILCTLGLLPYDDMGIPMPFTQEEYDIAHRRFQLLCILCGTDYHENVKGLGPSKVLDKILKHKITSYEEICVIEPKFSEIPYDKIMDTLKANMEYTIVHLPSHMQVTRISKANTVSIPTSSNPSPILANISVQE